MSKEPQDNDTALIDVLEKLSTNAYFDEFISEKQKLFQMMWARPDREELAKVEDSAAWLRVNVLLRLEILTDLAGRSVDLSPLGLNIRNMVQQVIYEPGNVYPLLDHLMMSTSSPQIRMDKLLSGLLKLFENGFDASLRLVAFPVCTMLKKLHQHCSSQQQTLIENFIEEVSDDCTALS